MRYLSDAPQQSGVDVQGMVDSGRRAIALAFVVELILAIVFLSSILLNGRVSLRPSASPSGGAGNPPVTLGNQIAGFIVVSIMFLAGAAMLLFSAYPTFVNANKLAQFSRATDAQITGVFDQPDENARQADYAFVVNGVNYSGSADYSGGYGDRGPLRIYYLPSDPNFSCVDLAATAKNAKFGLIFVLVWELIIGGVLYGVSSQISRLRR